MDIDYSGLPEEHRESIRLYLEHGVEPGSAMKAILGNNLFGTFLHCDASSAAQAARIVQWLYWNAPYGTWGSALSVSAHMQRKRAERAAAEKATA